MDSVIQDLRFALRTLFKSPGFAAVAILTLALGIGATTAIFSVVNGVLLAPLPYADAGRLVRVFHEAPEDGFAVTPGAFSPQDFEDLSGGSPAYEHLAAYYFIPGQSRTILTGDGEPLELSTAFVSADFFPALGVPAALGRLPGADEAVAGRDRVVVLSDGLWRSRFGADPGVIGATLSLDDGPFTVVGVMPPSFDYPAAETQAWVPISLIGDDDIPHLRGLRWMEVVGRLAPAVTLEAAAAETDAVLARLEAAFPETNEGWGSATVLTLRESLVGDVRPALLVLLGAVALVLLIACSNLANLLLARGSARRRELAVRMALGAGRYRVIRQLLTESVALALLGGALGLLVASWGVDGLVALSAGTVPRPDEIQMDGRVVGFALAISALTGVICGLIPSLTASRVGLHASLERGGRGGTDGIGRQGARSQGARSQGTRSQGTERPWAERQGKRPSGALGQEKRGLRTERPGKRRPRTERPGTRGLLVLAQMSLAVVLLVGTGLLIRSFWNLTRVDPGFTTENVLTLSLTTSSDVIESDRRDAYRREILERIGSLPGVLSVGGSKTIPLQGGGEAYSFVLPGRGETDPITPESGVYIVTPGYFRTLEIPLMQGRGFTAADESDGAAVLVVNEAMARRYWPDTDPVGEAIGFLDTEFRVVGVVADVRNDGIARSSAPAVYALSSLLPRSSLKLFIRTASDPLGMADAVRRAIWEVNPDQPIAGITTLGRVVSGTYAQTRFLTLLLTCFGVLAVALAAVGVYGVIAYTVSRRTKEVGIRMALGANAGDVLRLIIAQGAAPALAGLVVGLAAALVLTRVLSSQLYEVGVTDPVTFVAVALLLTLVALLASYVPARRAMRVDPMVALRAG